MKKKLLLLLPALALLGQGCARPGQTPTSQPPVQVAPVATAPDVKPVCPVTPQVFIQTTVDYTAAQLAQIRRGVVAPIAAYFSDDTHGRAVSIMIRKKASDLLVDIIIDQPGSDDAVYEGVMISPAADGTYRWVPTETGPDFSG